MTLKYAHRGYEYQDLLVAARLVDVMLETVDGACVEKKWSDHDIFDDLTTLDSAGSWECVQFKYTSKTRQALTLARFTNEKSRLYMGKIIKSALADRDEQDTQAGVISYRLIMRDTCPKDEQLLSILRPASPDPGPFLSGMKTVRRRFRAETLRDMIPLPSNLSSHPDLEWVCDRLIVELDSPEASLDLTSPGPAEILLLNRVQQEVGVGIYPNAERSVVDVAARLVDSARAARQGLVELTRSELFRKTELRSDFGAVNRDHPVDRAIEVKRPVHVKETVKQVTQAADDGKCVLLVGPPGQGKSWLCQQVVTELAENEKDWLVAEHYCYLGSADGELHSRVQTESVIGSLLKRMESADPEVVSNLQPQFAASTQKLEEAVRKALETKPSRRVALVIDGIDHVTRVTKGSHDVDPSLAMAEILADLSLPKGSTLVVLSQPGSHLDCFEADEIVKIQMPGLTDDELRQLAIRQGIIATPAESSDPLINAIPLTDKRRIDEFIDALSDRSEGNALYATYLCREAGRDAMTMAAPAEVIRRLPQYDESLSGYYGYLQSSLNEGAWVANILALLDFPVSRDELRKIRPSMGYMVNDAIDVLRPVLLERATQGGIRIYHESFGRYLRLRYQDDKETRKAIFDEVNEWLKGEGLFADSRAYRHLLPLLSEAGNHEEIVGLVDHDFVVNSIAAGFTKSAINKNLAVAVRSAAKTGNWPAVIRCVEISRSAETYEAGRFQRVTVDYADVFASFSGASNLAERLLHDGYPTMDDESGLGMCEALDELGAAPPWQEYMQLYIREKSNRDPEHQTESFRFYQSGWLRGRLRLASSRRSESRQFNEALVSIGRADHNDFDIFSPVDWKLLARQINEHNLSSEHVVKTIHDVLDERSVAHFIGLLSDPGRACLEFAEALAVKNAPESPENVRFWAKRAEESGLPLGDTWRLIKLGVNIGRRSRQPLEEARTRLLELAEIVQDHSGLRESKPLWEWLDACSAAAINDQDGLAMAEEMLRDPGWYVCWLRFTIGLASAEAACGKKQSELGLKALCILTKSDFPVVRSASTSNPSVFHFVISSTLKRAVALLDDCDWKEAVSHLASICDERGLGLRSPISNGGLLDLVVNTATPSRAAAARRFLQPEIDDGSGIRYYGDFAGSRLTAARLALRINDRDEAKRLWNEACHLLTAYGLRNDTTVFEILDPLHTLIDIDPTRGCNAVAKMQSLCKRVWRHTDGKGTYHVLDEWWRLLAKADPYAQARLLQNRLLLSCNDPNKRLHGARSNLWRTWYGKADPIVAGALRLTLEEPLDENDPQGLRLLAKLCDGTGKDGLSQLAIALLARVDERQVEYSTRDNDEFTERDRKLVEQLNSIAEQASLPRIAALPNKPVAGGDLAEFGRRHSPPPVSPREVRFDEFESGKEGIAQAVRMWQDRPYGEPGPELSPDQFANFLYDRIIELIDAGTEEDALPAVWSIANAERAFGKPTLLKSLANGLERQGLDRLAALAYTFVWTRSRGNGGWLTFGGETEIESLLRATSIDRELALSTIAEEVERFIGRPAGTYGITKAIIYGFANGGLGDSDTTAFEIWDEGFAAISRKLPPVGAAENTEDIYEAPNPDNGSRLLGDINAAFASATIAGFAHPGREQKRRTLLAIQALIDQKALVVAAPLADALAALSDPATLTWLLRLIELAGENAAPIIEESRHVLVELAQRPHLTVRVIARRLLSCDEIPLVNPIAPDPELMKSGLAGSLESPERLDAQLETDDLSSAIDSVAGVRLSQAERILPGLSNAVCNRVDSVFKSKDYRHRIRSQLATYRDQISKRWPDAFLASDETIEDVLQRTSAGVRGAWLLNHGTAPDPAGLENGLANAILNDPALPLAIERTRQPRPEIPSPPYRGDQLWRAIANRSNGVPGSETVVVAAEQDGDQLGATLEISNAGTVPSTIGEPYGGWRLVATVEQRLMQRSDFSDSKEDKARRYRGVELRLNGDRQALIHPPVAKGDIRAWRYEWEFFMFKNQRIQTKPIVGYDYLVRAAADGHSGLGVQRRLLTPSAFLVETLDLEGGTYFELSDDSGPALALITWRTEYDISEYYMPRPRLHGAGLVMRSDAFDRLITKSQGHLVFRDFVSGPSSLCI